MKSRSFLLACMLLLAVTCVSTRLLADSLCQTDHSVYQYQPCGTEAAQNIFPVKNSGVGLIGDFQGASADFSDSVQALVWRGNELVYTGAFSPTNQQLKQYDTFTLVPTGIVQAGDQVEFVLSVDDVNGHQLYYSQHLNQNIDGLNHTWATAMNADQCDPNMQGGCAFLGFEDLPQGEGSDLDYNDFKMWVYGVNVVQFPEPSTIVLLTGAPIAFLASKFRNLL